MNTPSQETLKLLSDQMALEPAEDTGCSLLAQPTGGRRKQAPGIIFPAKTAGGKNIRLMKTLLTSACERNCYYCPFRAGRDFRRATLKPDEMAQAFMAYQRSGIAEGLFLSSGVVGSGLRTQDQIIQTAEIIREKFHYQGYLHLKIMPGSERSQVERTMELASRVSVNLEAPNSERLQLLAPRKAFLEELLQPLRWIEEIRQQMLPIRAWNRRWPSTSTQFVVGAVGESDRELLRTTEYLHRKLNLQRAYFSAFHPVVDTPFEAQPAESPLRQLRLYQAAFLMRDYGFSVNEFQIDDTGNLPQSVDPKMAWADQHLRESPLELNTASLHDLLRVPGIGPAGARAIVNSRRQRSIHQVEDLYNLGVNPTRATPFILMNGKRPAQQLRFW